MGFLDKLLGRGKQIVDKGLDVASDAVDKAGEVADKGLDAAGDMIDKAEKKLGTADAGEGAQAGEQTPQDPGTGSTETGASGAHSAS
ncbi:MAG TPA: hypothetical protein VFA44_15435 [Gaiellaceae bacterium]|nr:hypothetical protein [Gaiellaceae bacterium]